MSKEPIIFTVEGKPQPAGSKRAFVIKRGGQYTGRAIVTDANPKSRDWKIDVQHAAKEAFSGAPWECPIILRLDFLVERPASHYRSGKNSHLLKESAPHFPTSKPDSTKLCRGVEDAITSVAWKDDSQIVTQTVTKRYAVPGFNQQGVTVQISEQAL